jgi:hypothetical protein
MDKEVNAASLLQVLNGAVASTVEEVFPDGVPVNNQQKGRHWSSANREIQVLYKQRVEAAKKLERSQQNGAMGKKGWRLKDNINV